MDTSYTALAGFYDILGDHMDYGKYAELAHKHNKEFGKGTSSIALDLACGTGSMALCLSKLGYDTIATDSSPEMLEIARQKAYEEGQEILFLCQDMKSLDLYGTVDLVTCTLDSLNYLTSTKDLSLVFSLVNNFLEEGGIFVFDLNTERKFREVYGENSYVFEDEGVYCGWTNYYNEKTGKCNFALSIFTECEDGRYERSDELHTEKCHKEKTVKKELIKNGFEIIGVYGDLDGTPATDEDMRHIYVARNVLPRKRYEAPME